MFIQKDRERDSERLTPVSAARQPVRLKVAVSIDAIFSKN